MSVNSILNLMRELDLRGALAAFERFVSSPQELDAMPAQLLLETLLQNEVNNRLIRKQQNLLRMSHLPYVISPSDIAYDSVRGDEFKAKLISLMTLDFIKLGQNLTVFGSAGTGKSYIAAMLGRLACMSGYTTLYYSASELIDNLQLSYGSP
ncbi:ATP-binding protein, partial [Succinatimonas hippei]|uniref:ATP-binding protein n=1 Tax=Succinatimonas hippei TaxID=626938 RepID=UPI002011C37B